MYLSPDCQKLPVLTNCSWKKQKVYTGVNPAKRVSGTLTLSTTAEELDTWNCTTTICLLGAF